MKKVQVVHIITKLELGGAQENTLFTLEHLDRSRFIPYLITGREGILVPEARALSGVHSYFLPELVREVNPLLDLLALGRIAKILKGIKGKGSPMICHTHSTKAGIVGRWGAWLAGANVVIHTIHGFGFHPYQSIPMRQLLIFLERLTAHITDRFIVVSEANIEKGVATRIFSREKAVLIRSGIEIEAFTDVKIDRRKKKEALGVAPQLPLVTMIGCLKPQKAPLDFVQVADIVLQQRDASFILVGDGVLRKRVERRVVQLGLEERFRLLGWRRDIPEILAATDILCLTSLWEGLPRVLLQAMAVGVPIVATAVDGTPEAVHHSINGFLVPPRDIAGAADKVIHLLDHPQEARAMGERGKKMVGEFDAWRMVREQERLYMELLRERGMG